MSPDFMTPVVRVNGVIVSGSLFVGPPKPKYNHWRTLHQYRGCEPAWLARWVAQIPSLGCRCRAGYEEIVSKYPPDFSSPSAFFEWGVTVHNLVNAKINAERGETRRIYTMDEAYSEWRPSDGMEV